MKLLVGLGNPGARYRDTYHNIGFEVIDELARRRGVALGSTPADAIGARVRDWDAGVLLAKPLTFMNLSGRAVADLARYYRIDPGEVLVIVDDVALPQGRLRLRRDGSAGGHNGLKSVIEQLGTDAFARLRVGVGRGDPRRDLADHVLSRIPVEARGELRAAAERAADAAEAFVARGIEAAMNEYNRDPSPGAADSD